MCPPDHFRVDYRINPWMAPGTPVDRELAGKQWQQLQETLTGLGHQVHTLTPDPALPDMVYAANGGFVLDGTAYGAQFRHPERVPEAAHHRTWYAAHGIRVVTPEETNEGEGDFAYDGARVLAGYGFRTDPAAHREVQELFGRPVVSLRLVDPHFYHLDTAFAVLRTRGDEHDGRGPTVAYYPGAFSAGSRRVLQQLYPDAVLATAQDAAAFGLNLVSDGTHVVLNSEASGVASKLTAAGFTPVPVELAELKKGGGSVKCCAQQLR